MFKKIKIGNNISFLIKIFFIFLILIKIFNINLVAKALDSNIKTNLSGLEENLAYLYCDSLNKDFFNGLEDESILKYEYFFSSMPRKKIDNPKEFIYNFKSKVNETCLYQLNESDEKELYGFLIKFKSNN